MNDLSSKIYTAKVLLLKQTELESRSITFELLGIDFRLHKEHLLDFYKYNLIEINDCILLKEYVDEYRKHRKDFEAQYNHGIGLPKDISNVEALKIWETYLTDKYCGLKESAYNNLVQKGEVEIDFSILAKMTDADPSPLDFISFKLKINDEKLNAYINEKIDLFIDDEITFKPRIPEEILRIMDERESPAHADRAKRFLSYQKQKDDFSKAIVTLANNGQPLNNLKINYTEIWEKNMFPDIDFLETALGMEREKFIEIKDIIEQLPKKAQIVSTDIYWKYPTVIALKVLPDFGRYDELIYKKFIPAIRDLPEKREEETETSQNVPESQRPFCTEEAGVGYLKFGKYSQPIKIGRATSQPFRLLRCLTEPFGTPKSIDSIFEAIREGVKGSNKTGILTVGMDRNKKIRIIEFAIKELQKGNKLRGKLGFERDNLKTKMWLEIKN